MTHSPCAPRTARFLAYWPAHLDRSRESLEKAAPVARGAHREIELTRYKLSGSGWFAMAARCSRGWLGSPPDNLPCARRTFNS